MAAAVGSSSGHTLLLRYKAHRTGFQRDIRCGIRTIWAFWVDVTATAGSGL